MAFSPHERTARRKTRTKAERDEYKRRLELREAKAKQLRDDAGQNRAPRAAPATRSYKRNRAIANQHRTAADKWRQRLR